MHSWNMVINAAVIGTDKKMPAAEDFPAAVAAPVQLIYGNTETDKEEKFLQSAALLYGYQQCGILPVTNETVTISPALEETKPYCSRRASQVLKDIFTAESISLLLLWLKQCAASGAIIPPELLPVVLSEGADNKKLQPYIPACTGNRGEWLSRFNERWNFIKQQTPEDAWKTGTPEQRKAVLKETRVHNPSLAREWLQQTWKEEDAATRLVFLEIISETASADDIAFLQSLSNEKSKKVKDEALLLLKQIPGAPIVLQYQQLLATAVMFKKEKAMLGLSSKMVLHFQLPAQIDESVFKTGIEKLSSTKEFTDEEFVIYQLMQSVPPAFWETQLHHSPEQIIQLFQKDATGKKMLPAVVTAIGRFKDKEWAHAMMQYSDVFYLDIIPLLPLADQERYSNQFFEQHAEMIIRHALEREEEWGYELGKNIVRHTATNVYQYPRSFYNQYIHLIPDRLATDLEKFTPREEYLRNNWSNTSEYILQLLHLKSQIIQSFHP